MRAEAGILYVLHQLSDDGHVFYPYEPLVEKCQEILHVDREVIIKALGAIAVDKRIVIEDMNDEVEEFRENNKSVYLAKFHVCETNIAARMKTLVNTPKAIREINSEKAIEWVQKQLSISLAEKQAEAIKCAIENKVMVITGGPGTGKTTIINAVLKILSKIKIKDFEDIENYEFIDKSSTNSQILRRIESLLQYTHPESNGFYSSRGLAEVPGLSS